MLSKSLLHEIHPPADDGSAVSLDRLRQLTFLPSQAVYLYEVATLDMLFVSEGFRHLFGIDPKEIRNLLDLYNLIYPQDLDTVLKHTRKTIAFTYSDLFIDLNQQYCEQNYRLKLLDGKLKMVCRQGWVYARSDLNIPTHYLCIFTDLTQYNLQELKCTFFGPNTADFETQQLGLGRIGHLLSHRELDILRLLALGYKSHQISEMLHISTHTVNTHRRNMLSKMETNNVAHMIHLAREINLI